MLPSHGPVACRKCFTDGCGKTMQLGAWKLQNDPCHWGSANPTYLVLGFSKGFTQADEFAQGRFEDVPFKGMRPRLGKILKTFGVLDNERRINEQFSNPENDIAFASLIRCSASRRDEKASAAKGTEIYSCTGSIIPKSFSEIPDVISNCAEEFLRDLPPSVKTVVLLGNGDAYIKQTKALLARLFESSYQELNSCAVTADGRLWVWASHPSGLNGHFDAWMSGVGKSGKKFHQALAALEIQHMGDTE